MAIDAPIPPMKPVLEVVDPLVDGAWDELVLSHKDHAVFHRSAWAQVLAETYGHKPYFLKVSRKDRGDVLFPIMEVDSSLTGRRGVSLPFSDFAGPLWGDCSEKASVMTEVEKFADNRGWKHLEIRGGMTPNNDLPANKVFAGHELDLSGGVESVERLLHSATRRAIRKSERSDLSFQISTDQRVLDDFYSLHVRTRRRHGLPPQPISFFRSIKSRLFDAGLGEVVLAYLGKIPVAGAVFLHSVGRAIYKFGASEKAHWNLRPNQLVMWVGIRHLISVGCHSLHFGRTTSTDSGLIQFKRSWGSSDGNLPYFRRSKSSAAWQSALAPQAESNHWVFGHLPLSLNRLAGYIIYPHLD